jgi:hypothetical protein
MRSRVITFDSRLQRRFAYLAADAARFARSDEESVQVERITQAVSAEQITLRDAHAALSHLRRQQQQAA